MLEFLTTKIRKEKERKWIYIGKEEFQLFIFADDTVLYLKDSKDSTKKKTPLINDKHFCHSSRI
jgi:c-di-AMP phosphodiesterase-like protein